MSRNVNQTMISPHDGTYLPTLDITHKITTGASGVLSLSMIGASLLAG